MSGANGYIAFWLVRTLLEKGYSVRGTVRSENKGKYLAETFKKYGDKFEVVVVEDVAKVSAMAHFSLTFMVLMFLRMERSTKP